MLQYKNKGGKNMKLIKKIIVCIFILILACSCSACNEVTLDKIYINENDELIVRFDDGKELNLGSTSQLKEDLDIEGAQGEKGDKGDTGAQGVGIKNVYVNDVGELIIVLTDDSELNAGIVDSVKNSEVNRYNLLSFIDELNSSTNFTTNIYEIDNENKELFVEYKCTEEGFYRRYYEKEKTYYSYYGMYFFAENGNVESINRTTYTNKYERYKTTYGSLSDTGVDVFNYFIQQLKSCVYRHEKGKFTFLNLGQLGYLGAWLDNDKLVAEFEFMGKEYLVEVFDVNKTQIVIPS